MSNYNNTYVKQRFTALLMLPLMFWFLFSVCYILKMVSSGNQSAANEAIASFVISPMNLVFAIVFFGAFALHSIIGIKTIIDDYVSCDLYNKFITLFLYIVVIVSVVAAIVSVLYFNIYLQIEAA